MAKESPAQQKTVGRVMHEFKHHELKGPDGKTITDRKQAIAIGLNEAGASNQNTPAQNRHNLAHTKRQEAKGETAQQEAEGKDALEPTRADLYAEARKRDIPNRSKMSKAQLERALSK
ncbi:MAG: hypothetical protein INR64_14780 [Caulobacteraceae bacterium]|nr:hypothetical protein [Caulobacter sp.]